MQVCSKSEWGLTSTVLMFMLYWREQMIGNCMYLLRNMRPTHTMNIQFTPMTMSRFRVDPPLKFMTSHETQEYEYKHIVTYHNYSGVNYSNNSILT